jgi:signal transduction histidine kinase
MVRIRGLIIVILFLVDFYAVSQTKTMSTNEAQALIKENGTKCWRLREEDPKKALKIGIETLQFAIQHKVTESLPLLNNYIGVIYIHYLFDVKNAIPYLHMALTTSLQNNDSIQIAYSYNNLGDAFMLTGNVPIALQYSEQSLEIFTRLDHPRGIAYGYYNLGLVFRVKGNYIKSVQYLEKARDIRYDIKDSRGYASVLMDLAKTYELQGKLEKAMSTYKKSYDCHVKINNDTYAAYCLNGIGVIHYLNENYDLAYENLTESLEINISNQYYFGMIDVYLNLALVYAKLGDIEKGEEALDKADKYSLGLENSSKIINTQKTYAVFYQILKDYKKASESFSRFIALNDSILSIQQFETLNEIQNNYIIRQNLNETKNELLSQKKDRNYLIIIILLMIILVVMTGLKLLSQYKMNRKLQEVNDTKDKMFSVISHDLKSPFNSLLGFSDLLIEDIKANNYKNAIKYASIIHSSTRETLNLLNNLLTWSRSQTGKIHFSPRNFIVNNLFNDLNSFFKMDSEENFIELTFKNNIHDEIFADQTIIRIILTNLISNALKYTYTGGKVVINAVKKGNHFIFSVTDSGTGISGETLKTLFETNNNIESIEGVRNEKGTGLGLEICVDLIARHNGIIYAKSELNEGSTFTIELPCIDVHTP